MAHDFSKQEILELCALTEDFAAKVLCPKVESYGVKQEEMQDAIGATLGACGAAAKMEVTKYLKGEKRWYVDEIPDEDTPAEATPDDDADNLASEMASLIKKIIDTAKKHANGDAKDYHAALASAALTIITTGGKGTAMAAAIGLNGVLTGKVKLD